MSPIEACHAGAFQRGAATDHESEDQKKPRRQHAQRSAYRQRNRDDEHRALRRQHQPAAVDIVGQRSREQRQQHDRQCIGGLHERDVDRRAR